jgi:hypothetical protein
MPIALAYLKWAHDYGDKPTPPAASMALKVVAKEPTLADRYNAQRKDRIITGRNVPIGMTA